MCAKNATDGTVITACWDFEQPHPTRAPMYPVYSGLKQHSRPGMKHIHSSVSHTVAKQNIWEPYLCMFH